MLELPVAIDHRPRVAAERRARMRSKLVESALLVFAEKGVDASVIEDVIAAAGVSRGTFYNYFRTNAELLVAAIQALGNEVVDLVESRVKAFPSPAARLLTGLRLYMDTARRYPLFARFIARVGPQAIGPDALVYKYIPIHIAEGIAAGEFVDANVGVALDMVVGAGLIAVARISAGRADDVYLSAMLLAVARSLGLDPVRAETLLSEPVAPLNLSADSLLVRSDARSKKKKRQKHR
ncbi:MAG TPA: TetR/AcrR family transcriptional regulator [Roseiarcus sp.]|nr:TetR/AcrR family transcriptional regulator [Roseiarcus sp.]